MREIFKTFEAEDCRRLADSEGSKFSEGLQIQWLMYKMYLKIACEFVILSMGNS